MRLGTLSNGSALGHAMRKNRIESHTQRLHTSQMAGPVHARSGSTGRVTRLLAMAAIAYCLVSIIYGQPRAAQTAPAHAVSPPQRSADAARAAAPDAHDWRAALAERPAADRAAHAPARFYVHISIDFVHFCFVGPDKATRP